MCMYMCMFACMGMYARVCVCISVCVIGQQQKQGQKQDFCFFSSSVSTWKYNLEGAGGPPFLQTLFTSSVTVRVFVCV